MNIVIVGAGSIGCFTGGLLMIANNNNTATANNNVVFLGRQRLATSLELSDFAASFTVSNGFRTNTMPNDSNTTTKYLEISDYKGFYNKIPASLINISTKPINAELIQWADAIIVSVKSTITETIAHDLALAHKEYKSAQQEDEEDSTSSTLPVVISLQNGVGNVPLLKSILNANSSTQKDKWDVIPAIFGANVRWNMNSSKFHMATSNPLIIGKSNIKQHNKVIEHIISSLNNTFSQSQTTTKCCMKSLIHPNIQSVQYSKLLLNLNNAVNALANKPLLQQLSDHKYRKISSALMHEALETYHANCIETVRMGTVIPALMPYIVALPNSLFFLIAKASINIDPSARSSMWDDIQLKRKTEIEHLQGEIMRLAKQKGVKTPVNHAVYTLIREAEESGIIPSYSSDKLSEIVLKENVDRGEEKLMASIFLLLFFSFFSFLFLCYLFWRFLF